MKALDRIYIDEDLIAFHCLTDRHDGDTEYIRKDALLEWLKAVKADPMMPMNIDRVIEKIESL